MELRGDRGGGGGGWSENPKLEAAMFDAGFHEKLPTRGYWFAVTHRTTAFYHGGEHAVGLYNVRIDPETDWERQPEETIGPCASMEELCAAIAKRFPPGSGKHIVPPGYDD